MSEIVIKVENLSKQYRIGAREGYRTFRETLVDAAKAPFVRLRGALSKEQRTENSSDSMLSAPGSKRSSRGDDLIWALKDVSFEVKQGEVVGIIGRNGAGKSTLLKILSRITEPTEGRVELRGRVGSLLEIGTGFHPELTGHENIYLYGAILGMDRWEVTRKFDEIVAFAELEKFIDTPVKKYSSGMYMRLAFAVAAHLEPEILLVDEVLAVGDAAFQKKCLGKMGDVAGQGRTVLFVSHQMNAVEQLCSKALLLVNGKNKQTNSNVKALIREYLLSLETDVQANEWANHGNQFENDWFRPLRFFISDASGNKKSMPASNDSDIWINLEGEVQEIEVALTVGFAVYSESGSLIFWSYQTDGGESHWPKMHKGVNLLMGKIPRRFLNEGTYRIELIGGLHFRQWLFEPGKNAPFFYLTIQGGLSDSPHWMGKRPGLLAPVLEWVMVR
ncbi:MAG: ABC transporter ATP-binding protein [Deltaproteobacteria bacterium]|nr:ABC transporter ATP-binding protein [Deltaproteobacteria bacterium]